MKLLAIPILAALVATFAVALAGTLACSPLIYAWIGALGLWRWWRGGRAHG